MKYLKILKVVFKCDDYSETFSVINLNKLRHEKNWVHDRRNALF